MKASYKKHTVVVGFQEVTLEPGQFIFGRKAASLETGLSEQTIRSCLRTLSVKKLHLKPTNKFTIITVVNWGTYQSDDDPINQQSTNNQPTINQQSTTNNKEKKVKNNPPTPLKGDAIKIYDFYVEKIQPRKKSKGRAVTNITTKLKSYSPRDLCIAVKNYLSTITEDGHYTTDPQYRKDPANFFGINELFCEDFLPGRFTPPKDPKPEMELISLD